MNKRQETARLADEVRAGGKRWRRIDRPEQVVSVLGVVDQWAVCRMWKNGAPVLRHVREFVKECEPAPLREARAVAILRGGHAH